MIERGGARERSARRFPTAWPSKHRIVNGSTSKTPSFPSTEAFSEDKESVLHPDIRAGEFRLEGDALQSLRVPLLSRGQMRLTTTL